MTLRSDRDTKVVLWKLALLFPSFYAVYYAVSVILVAALQVRWAQLGGFPFRISWDAFTPTRGDAALGSFLSMLISYQLAVLLNFLICRSSRQSWDYAATLSSLHMVVCCLVNLAFPTNWVWWVTILVCTAELGLLGELTVHYFYDMREIHLNN